DVGSPPARAKPDATSRDGAIADAMEAALVPTDLDLGDDVAIAVRYVPKADLIGGDFYDVLAVDGGSLFLMGDVAGHGLDAAQVMATMRAYLRGLGFEHGDPSTILRIANELLVQDPRADLVTAVVARWEGRWRRLSLASAGHVPPLVRFPDGTVEVLLAERGPVLGAFDDGNWATFTRTLGPATTVLLYTDGLIEQRAPDLADGIRSIVDRWASTDGDDIESVADALMAGVPDSPRDDVALAVIRFD
ncbi:MAG: PP2C family protein-serine/threonine phosphatase, partial [Acidimicrobiia bacterium]